MIRLSACLCFSFSLVFSSVTIAQMKEGPSIAAPKGVKVLTESVIIPIEESATPFFMLKMKLNGKGPYLFMLDTGTNFTVLSNKVIREVNPAFSKKSKIKVNGIWKNVLLYNLDQLDLGKASFYDYQVVVFPEPSLITQFNTYKNMQIDGILGYGAFKEYLLTLDYPNKAIQLRSEQLHLTEQNTYPYIHARKVPLYPILFKDQDGVAMQIVCVIDTGYSGYFAMPVEIKKVPYKTTNVGIKTIFTALGEYEVREERAEADAFFEKYKIPNPTLLFLFSDNAQSPSGGTYGLMGMKVLQQLTITFDQKKHLLQLGAPEVTTLSQLSQGKYLEKHDNLCD